jgi:hypothetical protein
MGIFASKDQKELTATMDQIKEFFDNHFNDWDRTLKLTIGAKRASEFPVEQIEPTVRKMWVECYARGIDFDLKAKDFNEDAARKYPNLRKHLPFDEYQKSVSFQMKKFGALLGNLVFEIGQIKPDYLEVLGRHLEEPELSVIKNEAIEAVRQHRAAN